MGKAANGSRALNMPDLPRHHPRRLPKGTKKLIVSLSLPQDAGVFMRKLALETGRSASALYAEALQFWLDSVFPGWNVDDA